MKEHHSLPSVFEYLLSRWVSICLAITLILVISFSAVVIKVGSEQEAKVLGEAIAAGFRNSIVGGDLRYTQAKIRETLPSERVSTVLFRDANLRPVQTNVVEKVKCTPEETLCWSRVFSSINVLQPIYTDAEQREVFGYLDLTVIPSVAPLVVIVVSLGIAIVLLLIWSLLRRSIQRKLDEVAESVDVWSEHTLKTPVANLKLEDVPYKELVRLFESLRTLGQRVQDVSLENRERGEKSILRSWNHDLRGDLSQVIKSIEIVRESSNLREKEERGLEIARKAIFRIRDRCEQIERADAEEKKGVQCDLSRVCYEYIEEIKLDEFFKKKDLKIKAKVERSVCARISRADFKRILQNLVENAVRASFRGSGLEISVSSSSSGPTLRVRDYGKGIAECDRKRVFDWGYTTSTKGRGLGLAIVRDLLDQNNGKIDFDSKLNSGSEFTATFQRVEAA